MSQHQQVFRSDRSGDVSRIAFKALSILSIAKERSVKQQVVALDFAPQLCAAVVSPDRALLGQVVKEIKEVGVSSQEIKTLLVPAVARRLGENWLGDSATFGDVTIGCARLQNLVRCLKTNRLTRLIHPANLITPLNCLVIVPQGTQHTLGAVVLADHLRSAGAHVRMALGVDNVTAGRFAACQSPDAIMISAPAEANIGNLRQLIQKLRQKSASAKIILGGGVATERSDLALVTGSDYVSNEIHAALDFVESDSREE